MIIDCLMSELVSLSVSQRTSLLLRTLTKISYATIHRRWDVESWRTALGALVVHVGWPTSPWRRWDDVTSSGRLGSNICIRLGASLFWLMPLRRWIVKFGVHLYQLTMYFSMVWQRFSVEYLNKHHALGALRNLPLTNAPWHSAEEACEFSVSLVIKALLN